MAILIGELMSGLVRIIIQLANMLLLETALKFMVWLDTKVHPAMGESRCRQPFRYRRLFSQSGFDVANVRPSASP